MIDGRIYPTDPRRKKSVYDYKVMHAFDKIYAVFYRYGQNIHAVTVPKDNKLRMDMLGAVIGAIDLNKVSEEILLPGILAI